MNVGLPIASVIPTLDGPVLATLAATTQPLSLTDVHRSGGRGSLNGVRRVLLRLIDVGLVDHLPGGYVLNREHLAVPAIQALAAMHAELAERIRAEVDRWSESVELIGLFGSAVRRDGDERSDIDVVVVSATDDVRELGHQLAACIRRWTGNDAQVLCMSLREFDDLRRSDDPIMRSWDRDLLVIKGDWALFHAPI